MSAVVVGLPSVRKRLASGLYETLLLLGVIAAGFVLPHMLIGLLFHYTAPGVLLITHVVLLLAAYFLWYWRHGGQTLAMQTWKIQLVSVTGEAPTWGQLLLRFLLAWPSIGFYGAGLLWAIFDRDSQFMHDRLSGTRIVFKASNQ